MENASFGENYAAQCISVKMAQEDVFGSEKELISKDAEDTDLSDIQARDFHTI